VDSAAGRVPCSCFYGRAREGVRFKFKYEGATAKRRTMGSGEEIIVSRVSADGAPVFTKGVEMDEDVYFGGHALEAKAHVERDDEVVIFLNNIHKTYLLGIEGVPALRGVSLSVRKGEFVCIFGTSGGGKTSLLNVIGTIDKPTKGEMWLNGVRITNHTTDEEFARLRLKHLGFVFQTFNLLSSLTALENVEMPMILLGELSREERRARAMELLAAVGMEDRVDHLPAQLSGGEQQRVTIARAMANKPSVLLLDEPTGDLDTVNTSIVMKLLTDLNKDHGVTLVMVTHDVGLKFFADRIIWMRDGKIQRVETVPLDKRHDMYRELHADVAAIEASKRRQHGREEGTRREEAGEGVDEEAVCTFRMTQVRAPTDYQTHPAHDKAQPQNFGNMLSLRRSLGETQTHTAPPAASHTPRTAGLLEEPDALALDALVDERPETTLLSDGA